MTLRPRCSTATAKPMNWTTFTWSIPAASSASARSIHRSPRSPTHSGSAITCSGDWAKALATRYEVGLLYVAGVVQGLALVTFPAASTIFTAPAGFALSGTQYGAMFIPQVLLAIIAAAFGSSLARRFGLRGVLRLGLCGDLFAMALLALSPLLVGTDFAFVVLCLATGALGLGCAA